MMRVFMFALLCWFFLSPSTALAANHTVVILDTSQSMKASKSKPGNDPSRRAVLATALLLDLAKPNTTLFDSFKVISFPDGGQWKKWKNPADSAPATVGRELQFKTGSRDRFLRALNKLGDYNAPKTFFYPPLMKAIKDLKSTTGGNDDVRTIVLLTDGVPDWINEPKGDALSDRQARFDQMKTKLKKEILPKLKSNHIQLYVMAFGSGVTPYKDFFDTMVENPRQLMFDPSGKNILKNMIEIFTQSYGYQADPELPLPSTTRLDLNKGDNPGEVAVVAVSKNNTPIQLKLRHPKGVNDGSNALRSFTAKANAYAVQWIKSPEKNAHTIRTNVTKGSIAVLRPSPVTITIQPYPPKTTQVVNTMAGKPFPLKVIAQSPFGGDPGVTLKIEMEYDGPKSKNERWHLFGAAVTGSTHPLPNGRAYEIQPVFQKNHRDPSKDYMSNLNITAKRGGGGYTAGKKHIRVNVWPKLAISLVSSPLDISQDELIKNSHACRTFRFDIIGTMPNNGTHQYNIGALLHGSHLALNGAQFTLDGILLEFNGMINPYSAIATWSRGQLVQKADFTKDHEICVTIGRPKAGGNIPLTLEFTFNESPYDDFKVMQPLTLKVKIAPPSLLEQVLWYLLPALLFFSLLALLWYMRRRPVLPSDLGYTLTQGSSNELFSFQSLGSGSPVRKALGMLVEKPVYSSDGVHVLALVRPTVDEGIYEVKASSPLTISSLDATHLTEVKGYYSLDVYHCYRLHGKGVDLGLRLQYEDSDVD